MTTDAPLLTVDSVHKTFRLGGGKVTKAVQDISVSVAAGESLGIVGESGSGKSTLASIICGLLRPDSGSVTIAGREVYKHRSVDRQLWRDVQMIFQDPYTSLNPAMSIGEIIAEPLRLWHGVGKAEAKARVPELLERVGMDPAAGDSRTSQLSGGQRQRISIARALAVAPKLMVFDESVSALDVSVQAQILELLRDLKQDIGLSYIFISHDIGVIRLVSDRVLVMNRGQAMEICPTDQLTVDKVQTEYTRTLLSAVPRIAVPHAGAVQV